MPHSLRRCEWVELLGKREQYALIMRFSILFVEILSTRYSPRGDWLTHLFYSFWSAQSMHFMFQLFKSPNLNLYLCTRNPSISIQMSGKCVIRLLGLLVTWWLVRERKKYYYKPLKKLTHIHFRLNIDSASAPNRQTQRRNWAKWDQRNPSWARNERCFVQNPISGWTGATLKSQSYNSTKMSFRICIVWRWNKCIVRRSSQSDRPHNAHRLRPKARRQCNFVVSLESNRISRVRRLCLRNQCT